MKKVLTLLLVISSLFCYSQSKPVVKKTSPVNTGTTTKKKYNGATTNAVNIVKHDTCLNKQFSIVFYIVQDSLSPSQPGYPGVNYATTATLNLLMTAINNAFKPICVSFVNCKTELIPKFTYGKSWKKNVTEAYVTGSHYTDKTINFYIVDTIAAGYGNTEDIGYTYEPTAANLNAARKDLLVIDNGHILNFPTTLHLLGHFFGLPHTFEEVTTPPNPPASPGPPGAVISQEFADGSNCATHGDRFCDTDADPNDVNPLQDGMGNYYIPPRDNIMSYYHNDRCRFTIEQYNYMAFIMATKRLYLH